MEFMVFFNAAEDSTTVKNEDILTWYKERHLKLPIMSHLATIVFSVAPSQAYNKQYLSLSGIFSAFHHSRFSMDMLS